MALRFAPFARVRLAAQAVHGDGQGFVGLGADGAEAHGAGGETFDDLLFRFHRLESDSAAVGAGFEGEQAA